MPRLRDSSVHPTSRHVQIDRCAGDSDVTALHSPSPHLVRRKLYPHSSAAPNRPYHEIRSRRTTRGWTIQAGTGQPASATPPCDSPSEITTTRCYDTRWLCVSAPGLNVTPPGPAPHGPNGRTTERERPSGDHLRHHDSLPVRDRLYLVSSVARSIMVAGRTAEDHETGSRQSRNEQHSADRCHGTCRHGTQSGPEFRTQRIHRCCTQPHGGSHPRTRRTVWQ